MEAASRITRAASPSARLLTAESPVEAIDERPARNAKYTPPSSVFRRKRMFRWQVDSPLNNALVARLACDVSGKIAVGLGGSQS